MIDMTVLSRPLGKVHSGLLKRPAGAFFYMLGLCLSTFPCFADGISSATPDALKKLEIPAQADMVVSGGGHRGDWAFIMGPLHDPEAQKLRLLRPATKDGKGVLFQCERKTGGMVMALSMPNVSFKLGEEQDVALQVGGLTRFVKMVVAEPPPPGRPPVFTAKGISVPEILQAMGRVAPGAIEARLTFGMQKKFAAFDLPSPREISKTSAALCHTWSRKHSE